MTASSVDQAYSVAGFHLIISSFLSVADVSGEIVTGVVEAVAYLVEAYT